ncbi:MAG: hypothetical protein JWL96_1644 [Sphingomonas bacterium]|nr:hypothetical protein [Sphingomonas bacterium]
MGALTCLRSYRYIGPIGVGGASGFLLSGSMSDDLKQRNHELREMLLEARISASVVWARAQATIGRAVAVRRKAKEGRGGPDH